MYGVDSSPPPRVDTSGVTKSQEDCFSNTTPPGFLEGRPLCPGILRKSRRSFTSSPLMSHNKGRRRQWKVRGPREGRFGREKTGKSPFGRESRWWESSIRKGNTRVRLRKETLSNPFTTFPSPLRRNSTYPENFFQHFMCMLNGEFGQFSHVKSP